MIMFCTLPLHLFGEIRIYRETTGDEVLTVTYRIEPSREGFSISGTATDRGKMVYWLEAEVDRAFATRSWKLSDNRNDFTISAYRQDNTLVLTKIKEEKKFSRELKIKSDPWFQLYPLSFEKFAAGGREATRYWSIDPDEAKAYEFSLTRKQSSLITVAGMDVQADHFRISLTGFLAMFWGADCWHRKADGKFMRYEGVNGRPGTPITITEFLSER
jgi:hypothetical protein